MKRKVSEPRKWALATVVAIMAFVSLILMAGDGEELTLTEFIIEKTVALLIFGLAATGGKLLDKHGCMPTYFDKSNYKQSKEG